jgi:hypothetical protein
MRSGAAAKDAARRAAKVAEDRVRLRVSAFPASRGERAAGAAIDDLRKV